MATAGHPGLILLPPQPPPDIPPGWELGPPDFVGVGTQRSGTTWWWSVLGSHPDVANPDSEARRAKGPYPAKEFHFFGHYHGVQEIDPACYHRYFPRPPGALAGEWTPRYMYDFWTPPMLARAAPQAKLLVMLRDPVARFLSGLAHWTSWGLAAEPIYADQFSRGLYWQQLQALMCYFSRGQVLVLQYERCVADPVGEAVRTFDFLGCDPGRWQAAGEITRPVGVVHKTKPALPTGSIEALRRAYQPDVRRLLADFPEIDGSLWPTL
jgi:hypothetical protein